MTNYRKSLVLHFSLFVVCIAFWCAISYFQHQSLSQSCLSSVYGLLVFILPQSIYRLYMKRRIVSAGMVVLQLIYAHILKYAIFILLLGLCFKFMELNNKIVLLTFVFAYLVEIAVYSFAVLDKK